jgi:hypothetical protein
VSDRADDRDGGRVLRLAVLGSVLVHALGFFLWGIASNGFANLRAVTMPTPPPVVVTTSNAIRIERRARPHPAPRPARPHPRLAAPSPAPRPVAEVEPRPLVAPVIPRRPQLALPQSKALHELAKSIPTAAANPPRTVRATQPPKPEPTTPGKAASQRVALAQPPQPQQRPAPSNRSQLSQAQLSHIGQDIQKTLSELRAESNPLAVRSTAAPSSEHRYRVQMVGLPGELHHAQGTCYPIKSWVAGGYDYYYESCEVQFEDGHYETQAVPWPIRYPIGHDLYHGDLGADVTVPLPPPLAGWKLPPGQRVSDELRQYAHDHGFDI